MTTVDYETIDNDVDKALRSSFKARFSNHSFSYSRTPSKPLNDNGLGMTWQGWRAYITRLYNDHLVKRDGYDLLDIDPLLIEETLDKQLTSIRRQLAKRLEICVKRAEEEE